MSFPEVDPDFGNWLAGFVDGEGCFLITHGSVRSGRLHCALRVQLRRDDLPILQEIQKRTGIGRIVARGARRSQPNPANVWQVQSRAHCVRLVELFDAYPLRARKARDYAHWRQAVLAWTQVSRCTAGVIQALNAPHWNEMDELRLLLNAGRRYDSSPALALDGD